MLYFLVTGLVSPSFGTFGYYFYLNVIGISKFAYAMLTVVGYAALLVGTLLYNKYFTEMEFRSLILMDAVLTILIAPFTYILVFRKTVDWGISDMSIIIFSSTVSEILSTCFIFLPMSIIMTKICPKHIEATSFALLTGVHNFRYDIRSWIGAWINERFVEVTEDDLSKYWILVTIGLVTAFLPLLFIWMIPT